MKLRGTKTQQHKIEIQVFRIKDKVDHITGLIHQRLKSMQGNDLINSKKADAIIKKTLDDLTSQVETTSKLEKKL